MFIQIIKVPDGEAPFEVRERWVGCVLEADFFTPDLNGRGIVTGTLTPPLRNQYGVAVEEALHALAEQKGEDATDWWEELESLSSFEYFLFGADECQVVTPD